MIQAIILLGGKGTRLSRLFPDRPKALVSVAGQPFLERQLAWLGRSGITHIHLAAGHLAGAIQSWLVQAETRGEASEVRSQRSEITCSIEPEPLGTGGALKFAEQYIRSDPFLVLNGDTILPQLDFIAFQTAYEQAHPLVSIAVTQIKKTGRFGTIEFDRHQLIRAFHEKSERKEGWVNGGAYLMDKKTLALIDPGKRVSLETEAFPMMAAQEKMRAYPVPPPLLDMGTPDGLAAMEQYFQNNNNKSTR